MVCSVSTDIADTTMLGVLYDVFAIPMKLKNGFFVIEAKPHMFRTRVETDYMAHSMKRVVTEFRAVDLKSGAELFYKNLGNQTVNIGEFLAVVEAAALLIESDYEPKVIYTDSLTALRWFNNKATGSQKRNKELQKAEIFLKAFAADLESVSVRHWDSVLWGEIPADFGNKR